MECFLLAVMAYDLHDAICHQLHYKGLMTTMFCIHLVTASYLLGGDHSLTHLTGLLSLSFCGPNVINHYFCDIPLLFQLSCFDTQYSEIYSLTSLEPHQWLPLWRWLLATWESFSLSWRYGLWGTDTKPSSNVPPTSQWWLSSMEQEYLLTWGPAQDTQSVQPNSCPCSIYFCCKY